MINSFSPTKSRKSLGLAMSGVGNAFAKPVADIRAQSMPQPQAAPPPTGGLPANFGFNDLAGYEDQTRQAYGQNLKNTLADRRSQLANSLQTTGKSLFDYANPDILEDLNKRGVMSSPNAVASAQANALEEIALKNQSTLNDFDNSATSAQLGADQSRLDSGLDLRRSQLESTIQGSQADREEALARDLAKKQGRNSLTNALISGGAPIIGAGLGKGGFLSGLFGGGGGTVAGGGLTAGSGAPAWASSSLFPGGLGSTGAGAAPAAGGIGLAPLAGMAGTGYALSQADQATAPAINNAVGNSAGSLARVIANPIGSQINAAKSIVSNPGKAISKAFCFDAHTPIEMADGSTKHIKDINLGEDTKGGVVLSHRASICEDGDLFRYFGIVVTGSHAVQENGAWIRVGDSPYSTPLAGEMIVYSLVTTKHKLFVNGNIFADEFETDDYEDLNPDESLEEMNRRDGLVRVN